MKAKMQPIRVMQFGFSAALAVLCVVGMAAYRSVIASNESTRWTQHTYEVLEHIAGLRSFMQTIEREFRDFLLSGDEAFLQSARADIPRLRQELTTLSALTTDNAGQQRRIVILADMMQQTILRGDTLVRLPDTSGREP